MPEGIGLQQLAQDVQQQTSRIKRNHLYLQSLLALGLSALLWPLLTPLQRRGFYPKHFAVWAGITSLDLNLHLGSRAQRADTAGLDYLRAVPTGPLCPLVLAVTSVHDQLHLGFAFRTSAFSREAVDGAGRGAAAAGRRAAGRAVAVTRWSRGPPLAIGAGAGRLCQRAAGRAPAPRPARTAARRRCSARWRWTRRSRPASWRWTRSRCPTATCARCWRWGRRRASSRCTAASTRCTW